MLCETCNWHGPLLPNEDKTLWWARVELHRAFHQLWRELSKEILARLGLSN